MAFTDLMLLEDDWIIKHDPGDEGRAANWGVGLPEDGAVKASVPGLVHLYLPGAFGIAWYQTRFADTLRDGGRILLRFASADFLSEVWLNGKEIGSHRGVEDPFEFDVTDAYKRGGENLLCLRVSKPYSKDVDGYRFEEIPHRNECKNDIIMPGTCFNTFGLGGKVDVVRLPDIYISDLYVIGDVKSKTASVRLTVMNMTGKKAEARLGADVFVKRTGEKQTGDERVLMLAPGENAVQFDIPVSQMRLWDVNDPFLYTLRACAVFDGERHETAKSFGFRTFIVDEKGWFRLNGRRIFLKCSHTGNFYAGGNNQPLDPSMWRQDIAKAKACGFNAIRFISGAAYPDQLDACDELGLMVYEEPYAGWLTQNGPRATELYRDDLLTMVKRDRSHASLTIIGTLNETVSEAPFGDFVMIARESLDAIRDIDETRLVLYSSGRFDGDSFVGSVCNPYSRRWECLWDEENEKTGKHNPYLPEVLPPLREQVGDVHLYPRVPVSDKDEKTILDLGKKSGRPVFVSEFGVGSLLNTRHAMLRYEMEGITTDMPDMKMVKHMDEQFLRDLKKYGLEDIYPFPIDLLRESERLHNRQRSYCFDLVRANPRACGFSITGMLDHSICGEGLWSITREFKPGIAETLERGFAPLRWCLFVRRTNAYRGKAFEIEGVLANEDVLRAGESYEIGVKITGEDGTVWSKSLTLKVTKDMTEGMSVPVFREKVALDVPEGRYELHAEVLTHATASDGCLPFYITDSAGTKAAFRTVYTDSIGEKAEALLKAQGVSLEPLEKAEGACLVLIGEVEESRREAVWAKINALCAAGARVFVASRYTLVKGEDWSGWLPLEDKPDNAPHLHGSADWLYHKEYIARRHPYFRGLPAGRIMDWDYWMHLVGGAAFSGGQLPDDVAAACVGPGNINADGYLGGFNIGTYRIGKGALTLSSFTLLEWAGENPAADRLLINVLNTESEKL